MVGHFSVDRLGTSPACYIVGIAGIQTVVRLHVRQLAAGIIGIVHRHCVRDITASYSASRYVQTNFFLFGAGRICIQFRPLEDQVSVVVIAVVHLFLRCPCRAGLVQQTVVRIIGILADDPAVFHTDPVPAAVILIADAPPLFSFGCCLVSQLAKAVIGILCRSVLAVHFLDLVPVQTVAAAVVRSIAAAHARHQSRLVVCIDRRIVCSCLAQKLAVGVVAVRYI